MAIRAALDIAGYNANPYVGSDQQTVVPWIVYTDDSTQTEVDIMAAGVLPARGDTLVYNTYLAASNCTMKREDKCPTMWRAQVTYKPDSLNQVSVAPNPCDRPIEVEWDSIAYTVPAVHTVEPYIPPGETLVVPAGSPVVNSAWDFFDPPAEKTDYNWIATVVKNVPDVPSWVREMAGRVNNSQYMLENELIPEGFSRLIQLRIGKRQRQNGFNFRELRIGIEFRDIREPRFPSEVLPLPYILEVLDQGYNERAAHLLISAYQSAGPSKPKSILGADGRPVSMPMPLTGNGQSFLSAQTPLTVVYRHFKIYRTADFSKLPLAA